MGMRIEELVAENDRLNRQLAYEAAALTMMKADYENRLKADMVDMLEELKKEIVETTIPTATILGEIFWNMGADAMKEEIETRIQQKINSLKELKMSIDKELFYPTDGLKYPVVARPYTDDMKIKEKFYTKADMVAMLTEIQLEIEEIKPLEPTDDEDWQYGCFHGLKLMQDKCLKLIQQKINSLKEA